MSAPAIAGLILAGGASTRMGTPKALLRIGEQTFLDRLIELFSQVCSPVIVVLGHQAEAVRSGIDSGTRAKFAVNPDPELGMFSSLQCGLRELPPNTDGVLFSPVDYPNCQSATLVQIVSSFRDHDCDVVMPVYGYTHGHPVLVSRLVVQELLNLPVTAQARDVIRRDRERTLFVAVDDEGIVADIDTPEDYKKLAAE